MPKFDYLTPPYFCDIDIFEKVTVTLTIFLNKNLKSNKEVLHLFLGPLSDFLVPPLEAILNVCVGCFKINHF